MQMATRWAISCVTALAVAAVGCSKEEPKSESPPAKSATPKPAPSVAPPVAAPTAAEPTPSVDCPKGSTGPGTFDKPCEATGKARMMEVTWTGKMDEKGPTFKVINKSPSVILHGKVVVYYYDKAGKQLEIPASAGSTGKAKPYHSCGGFIFGGVMKPEEKAFFTFSCVKKDRVPEGTKAIEAEIQTVGFADETEKKVAYYWRNNDLTPDERPKGGIKK